jgi:hypothetical protein
MQVRFVNLTDGGTDTDGDGIPEILDTTPYGTSGPKPLGSTGQGERRCRPIAAGCGTGGGD